jgi:Flp pilus assembly protein TadD
MTQQHPIPAGDSSGRPQPPDDAVAFLKLAIEKLARGDAKTACAAASEACHRAPGEPRAHYAYGQAWLALTQPARAEQAFATALQLSPDWVDAWINYGVARYRQGNIEAAKKAMREALLRQPGHPAAAANLGAFMRLSGESEGAEALLREVIAREPANAGARLNLVADLLEDERAAEALALLDETAPPDGVSVRRHWHLQRMLALIRLQRTGEAHAALDAFLALGDCPPDLAALWHWRLLLLALAEGDLTRAVLEAERIEAALAEFGLQMIPEHRVMSHFNLATFWSGRENHVRAFRHWGAGHALLKASQPFSRDDHAAFIDANISSFTKARFETGPRARNRDPTPVFIVGMPRSGTTLCEQILAAHRDVYGAGERVALQRTFAALGGGGDNAESVRRVAARDAMTLDDAAARYLSDLCALAPEKARIVDKMPLNFSYIGLIALMLPYARIIYCARDPRDIGLSIFTFRFHGYHPYAHDLADLGWYIGQHGKLMDHWRTVLPDAIITVSLADWVQDFDGTLKRVLDHVGLPRDQNCARFYENDRRVRTVSRSQVRQPVNARGLGRWRDYAKELAPLIEKVEAAGALAPWQAPAAVPDTAVSDTAVAETFARLLAGRYIEGWADYEQRWEWKGFPGTRPNIDAPTWRGQDLTGRHLLVFVEQGLGDVIQFARYLPLLIERGAKVTLLASANLVRLLRGLNAPVEVVVALKTQDAFDFQCALMSLPHWFNTELSSIPSKVPYLSVDKSLAARWVARLATDDRPKVGIVWSGNPVHKSDHNRSIALSALLPLLETGATFVSLQKDIRAPDHAVLKQRSDILDFSGELSDLADTAAVILQLDLVISVDTSAAHLAGALGKPVWVLLPFRPDWRWLIDRDDSPWYPTARLFRQTESREWARVIDRVRDALIDFVASRRS